MLVLYLDSRRVGSCVMPWTMYIVHSGQTTKSLHDGAFAPGSDKQDGGPSLG